MGTREVTFPDGRVEQFCDGVGPGTSYGTPSESNTNWWAQKFNGQISHWACRHGSWYSVKAPAKMQSPDKCDGSCGPNADTEEVTEEDLNEAAFNALRLLKQLES